MREFTFILCLGIVLTGSAAAQTTMDNFTRELEEIHRNSEIPGFAVSIMSEDSIFYKKSFGYQNIISKEKFSTNQRFYVASVSKTFIGLALMKLIESGELEISTPINNILPFKVINPNYPNTDITIEHLARHTSSITYKNLEQKSWYLEGDFKLKKKVIGKTAFASFRNWAKNNKIGLGAFLKQALTLDGEFFSKARFSKNKPGEAYEYSNIGAALAAYIIEIKTKTSYDEHIENLMIEDFGFKPGIWRHRLTAELPTSYFQTKIETPVHKPLLYPAGGMMLSCDELTKYNTEIIKGFYGNSSLLQAEYFQKMMTPQKATNDMPSGIFWELQGDKVGHNGGNYGVTCFMSFDKTSGIGKVFMTNISSYKNDELLKEMVLIWKKLDEF